jgi:predicted MPP superfamily phosphohydrolase
MTRFAAVDGSGNQTSGESIHDPFADPNQLTITRQEMRCNKLPRALDGLRICLLADFHFRPDQNDELLAKAVSRANEEKPDLIALAGDFADAEKSVLTPLLQELEKLRATHGVFAVMGNHDG